MASTTVREDLYAIEAPVAHVKSASDNVIKPQLTVAGKDGVCIHVDMRAVRREQLLAGLSSEARVDRGEDNIANRDMAAALVLLDERRKIVLLNVSRPVPWREEAHLAEVSIVGEIQLRPQTQDLAVKNDGARVVSAVPVKERKPDIDNDIMERGIRQDGVQRIPRVLIDFILKEVIQTA